MSTMTATGTSQEGKAAQAGGKDAIRPFQVKVPEMELTELRNRIIGTRWPDRETDASQGVSLATMQALARHWATEYDWRKVEARLNALPQFMTEIDGLDIHFIHVRSQHQDALPLLVTHGWPGSVIEQLKIIDPLTNPTAHGGKPSDAFHVVIPNMPGYGFSGKPTSTGWDPVRVGRAWIALMKRLGYKRFVAQGGDWGGVVVDMMAVQGVPELIGIHTNMPGAVPADVWKAVAAGGPVPTDLSAEERDRFEKLKGWFAKEVAYALQMGLRPQTLYGIADSPVGLAAWFIDHDLLSYQAISRLFVDGTPYGAMTRDDVLDNITLTWLTTTGISGGRLYWENKLPFFDPKGVSIPVAVSVFADEIDAVPRSWAERAYPKLIFYNSHDRGGHFAAWERPELLVGDLRAGFKSLR
jgi:pimeloyl-ACP methyl ester carboxylesterase